MKELKISCFFGIALLGLSIICASGAAAELKLGQAVLIQKGKATVPVYFKCKPGELVSALSCTLSYNPAVLAAPEIKIGPAGKLSKKDISQGTSVPGQVKFSVLGMNANKIPGGVIAKVTFSVVGKQDKANLSISGSGSSPEAQPVTITVAPSLAVIH